VVNALTEVFERWAQEPAVLVEVVATQGSAPREAGAWMVVSAQEVRGTIGGGHLEFDAIAQARQMLSASESAESARTQERRVALGPSLGQCCGGVVQLRFERLQGLDAAARQRLMQRLTPATLPVALFGGGHVGRAIVQACAPLPVAVHWIDSREGIFPPELPPNVRAEHSEPVQAAVDSIAPGSRVLIMSFSHAEDLDVVARCLRRQRVRGDLPFVGLIGSKSKWAAFRHRLEARGFSAEEIAQVRCPIGVPGIRGKEPAVIAAAVVAQLLQTR
jgi:xanthine dehydrogenase accessory factor